MQRVITNLVDNALKFTPSAGQVTVAVVSGAEGTRVSVSDGGPGIPSDAREMIFEKYGQVRGARQPRRSITKRSSCCSR